MSTGDLKNQGTRLQSLLRTAKYPGHINFSSLFYGNPHEFLPLLHYLFLEYSLPFTKLLSQRGYEISGKSDKHFIDDVYKALRDEFQYVPRLSREKFFSNGFAEQKIILTSSAYQFVMERYRKKAKSKLNSNKENVVPLSSAPQCTEKPQKVETTVKNDKVKEAAVPEYSPVRLAPKPNSSQLYNLSDVMEESIIEVPAEQLEPRPRVYSEAGAREVYALEHLTTQSTVEILDSTPYTVLRPVEQVPVSETPAVLPVCVTRELAHMETTPARNDLQCVGPCSHARDIADIKKLLVTINARLDILESKAKHSERRNNCYTTCTEQPANNIPECYVSGSSNVLQETDNSVSGSCIVLQETDNFASVMVLSDNSSIPAEVQTDENSDDIKIFLESVKVKLNDTRSFLRTYDTKM